VSYLPGEPSGYRKSGKEVLSSPDRARSFMILGNRRPLSASALATGSRSEERDAVVGIAQPPNSCRIAAKEIAMVRSIIVGMVLSVLLVSSSFAGGFDFGYKYGIADQRLVARTNGIGRAAVKGSGSVDRFNSAGTRRAMDAAAFQQGRFGQGYRGPKPAIRF